MNTTYQSPSGRKEVTIQLTSPSPASGESPAAITEYMFCPLECRKLRPWLVTRRFGLLRCSSRINWSVATDSDGWRPDGA